MAGTVDAARPRDLLRFATAGSVDDGKSTLVGRLLYDTKSVLADQIEAVERVSVDRGLTTPDLSLLVDGLRAEREQGITIDVAYRYFGTTTREFYDDDRGTHYAQARYLCYYLQQRGLLRKYYHAFVGNVDADPTGYKTLQKILGEEDMDAFQKRWQTWSAALKFRQ